MKVNNYKKPFVLLAIAFVFSSAVLAQDVKPAEAPPAEAQRPAMKDRHADFLHRLGLSEDQLQQIRKLHQERKSQMDESQKRLREATRALNESIYADQASESDVQSRINELQSARSEIEKMRFMTEFAVRRLLTQEQLVRFRELRQQFENMREEIELKRRNHNMGDRPFNRQRNGNGAGKPVNPNQAANPTDQQRQDM